MEKRALIELLNQSQTQFATHRFLGCKGLEGFDWESYASVFQRAQCVKKELDLSPHDIVALAAKNSKEWVYIMLAVLASGATLVPMYEGESEEALMHILEDAKATHLICSNTQLLERLVCEKKSNLNDLSWKEAGDDLMFESVDKDAIAFILYTSGTTADPKGVPLSHQNIAYTIATLSTRFPLKESDRSLSFLPWAHSFGLIIELLTLCANGASIGIAESVQTIIPNLVDVRPTILFSVPRLFSQFYTSVQKRAISEGAFSKQLFDDILSQKGGGVFFSIRKAIYKKKYINRVRTRFGGELKYAVSGGAALSPETARFMDSIGIQVYEGYGLTETSAMISFNLPDARKTGSVGVPICDIEIHKDTVDSEDSKIGEICVKGEAVMSGYLNRPGLSFTDEGFFRTGDLGYLDSDGYLWISGRLKEQYKLSIGKYVAPARLEKELHHSPYIEELLIFGENRAFNIALVQLDEKYITEEGGQMRDRVLSSFEEIQGPLRAFEKVKDVLFVKLDLPEFRTQSGKLKRRKIIDFYAEEIRAVYEK